MRMKVLWVGVVASLLACAVVTAVSALQTPTYEASVRMWMNFQKRDDHALYPPSAVEGLRMLTPLMASAIDARPYAKEAVRRLGLEMSPDKLLDNLTVESVDGTNLLRLTYEDADAEQAARIVGTLAEVASEQTVKVSPRKGGVNLTAAVYEKATVPDAPVSPKPLRNGLIALVAGLTLTSAWAIVTPRLGLPPAAPLS
jgi:capsular polysaccharide biosynthesis protein